MKMRQHCYMDKRECSFPNWMLEDITEFDKKTRRKRPSKEMHRGDGEKAFAVSQRCTE